MPSLREEFFPELGPRRRRRRALVPLAGPIPELGEEEIGVHRPQVTPMGGLWRVLDLLSRGEYATAGLARQAIRDIQEPGYEPEYFKTMWRGITGKEKTTFPDVLKEDLGWVVPEGTPWYAPERLARGTTGLAGSIFLDPLTYIGIGTIGKLRGAEKPGRALLRIAGKPVIRGAKLGKPVFAGRQAAQRLWQATRIPSVAAKIKSPIPWAIAKSRAAFTRKLPAEFADTEAFLGGVRDALHYASHNQATDSLAQIKRWSRLVPREQHGALVDAVEWGLKHDPANVSDAIRPVAQEMSDWLERGIQQELAAGAPISRLGENRFLRGLLDEIDGIDAQIADLQRVPATRQTLKQTVSLKAGRQRLIGQVGGRQAPVLQQVNQVGQEIYGGEVFRPFADTSQTRAVLDEMQRREIGYFPHLESQHMARIRKSTMPELPKGPPPVELRATHASMKPRHFVQGITGRRPTAREIRLAANTPVEAGSKLSQYSVRYPWMAAPQAMPVGTEILEADPWYAIYVRDQMRAQSLTKGEFRRRLGQMGADTQTALRTAQLDPVIFPGTAGRWFAPEEVRAISETYKPFFSDAATRTIIQLEDKVHSAWRQWTLLPWFKFHSRNIASAWWNSGLRDAAMYNPWHLGRGLGVSRKAYFRGVEALPQADQILWREAARRRVVGGGFFTTATGRRARQAVGEATGAFRETISGRVRHAAELPLRAGAGVAEISESGIRYAHFRHLVKNRGLSFDDAAKSVMKYQFDYDDLSNFERNVLRRIFPLMTWTRKNIPLQLEHLFTKPGRYAALGKFVKTVHGEQEEAGPLQTHLLPQWMQTSIPVRLWGGRGPQAVVDVGTLLPTGELIPFAEILRPDESIDIFAPTQILTEQLSPILKTPLEVAMRRQMFTGRSIRGRELEHVAQTFFRGLGEFRGARRVREELGVGGLLLQRGLMMPRRFDPGEERRKQLSAERSATKRYYTQWQKEQDPAKKERLAELYRIHEQRLRQIMARPAFGGQPDGRR